MPSLSSWLRLCCLLKVVDGVSGYVLFAANVDDFRNIAKGLIPEPIAEKLASLASNMPTKQTRVDDDDDSDDYESEDFDKNEDDVSLETHMREVEKTGKTYGRETKINFEELVERVKERLAMELNDEIQKRLKGPRNNKDVETPNKEKYVEKGEHVGYIDKRDNYKSDTYANNKYAYKQYPEDKQFYDTQDQSEIPKNSNKVHLTQDPYQFSSENIKINNRDNERGRHKASEQEDSNMHVNNNFNVKNKVKNSKHYELPYEQNEEGNVNKKINNERDFHEIVIPKKIKNDERYVNDENEPAKQDAKPSENKYNDLNVPIREVKGKLSFSKPTIKQKLEVISNTEHFNQFDLLSNGKNDSYEDYEIPKKEENIYESHETTKSFNRELYKTTKSRYLNRERNSRYEIEKNYYPKNVKPFADDWKDEYEPNNHREQEIKAKTESLWFNDDRLREAENIPKSTFEKSETRKAKGTMRPTREYYKVVSPNYYISIPTVAEKYDSNEPLPEKDREREYIKHFLNPPATINKKVRLI